MCRWTSISLHGFRNASPIRFRVKVGHPQSISGPVPDELFEHKYLVASRDILEHFTVQQAGLRQGCWKMRSRNFIRGPRMCAFTFRNGGPRSNGRRGRSLWLAIAISRKLSLV